MDSKKIMKRTFDIIEKYYKHSKKYPVLKHKTPEEHRKAINLTIPKK